MDVGGPHLDICRKWIDEGTERATEDFDRFYAEDLPTLSEPSLRDQYLHLDEPDTELARTSRSAPRPPRGHPRLARTSSSTGATTSPSPAADTHTPAHYVSHDMNHVISGYEPTGPGEIALGAFTLAMNDNDANWLQFIANLVIHEAGLLKHGSDRAQGEHHDAHRCDRPRRRGVRARRAAARSDFSQADHLAMADWPLGSVRAYYNVVPMLNPMV